MESDNTIQRGEEGILSRLRELYRMYGYACFKMSKFEEYDLYGQNKEFLVSDSVITFTDTNGKLMALKPDVTLSIVKNTVDVPGLVQRLYYNENVYRISDRTHQYKEILQAGLECIGDLGAYNLCEVLRLAARSLAVIAEESVLTVSHLGVISALTADLKPGADRMALLRCIQGKNPHGVRELCTQYGVPEGEAGLLVALTSAYGEAETVLPALRASVPADLPQAASLTAALGELEATVALCGGIPGVRVCVDLSLTGDMNYYNGLIFRGYVKGIPASVLSGGQYDRLMAKMGKRSRAVGFAVYLDLLERLEKEGDFDVDVLLISEPDTPASLVADRVEALVEQGLRVAVQSSVPERLRYRRVETLTGKEGG